MFSYFKKKKLLNYIIKEYEEQLYIYEIEVRRGLEASLEFSEMEIQNIQQKSTQKYYEYVFNTVCNTLSEASIDFKTALPFKFLSCDFNPDNLTAWNVLQFAYSCMCNKEIDPKLCMFLNHYVANLKNSVLDKLENDL